MAIERKRCSVPLCDEIFVGDVELCDRHLDPQTFPTEAKMRDWRLYCDVEWCRAPKFHGCQHYPKELVQMNDERLEERIERIAQALEDIVSILKRILYILDRKGSL